MNKLEIKKILIATDFTETSELAINEAIGLAKVLNANIILLHVIEYSRFSSPIANMDTISPSSEVIEDLVRKKFEKKVSEIENQFGIRPDFYIEIGNIPTEVIRFSNEHSIDLIIMGTHGASGFKELFIGSNAQRVVTLSEIPVLTMQQKASIVEFKNILIPIDNSVHSREKLNIALVFAELFKAKIHIIGLPDSEDAEEMAKFHIKLKSVEDIITKSNLTYSITLVNGQSLAKAALEYASNNQCDLIVINTGHESKITGIFLGAFAQQIVNHSLIPVLSVRHLENEYTTANEGYGV